MPLETTPSAPSTELSRVPREHWADFFDAITTLIEGSLVEIEVAGLDLGDQIQVEWLRLNGLTYDPKADTFYVFLEDEDTLDHAISRPREILVHLVGAGLDQVVVDDSDGHRNIIRLRQALSIPIEAS